jgi:DNA-binding transcriptional ArsR family regulator
MNTDSLSRTLQALADPTRRAILAQLALSDASVAELAQPFDMSVRAVSKHVGVLERAGLVSRSRDAQRRLSHLEASRFKEIDDWLADYRRFWDRNLDSLGTYLRTMQRKASGKKLGDPKARRKRL